MNDKENILLELEKNINMAEWKLEALPESYFIDYFEIEFLPTIKSIYKKLKKV